MTGRDKPIAAHGFDPVTLAHLAAAGIDFMGQLVGTTLDQRRERLPDLPLSRHQRLTAVLAEMNDDDVRRRCHHFGEAA